MKKNYRFLLGVVVASFSSVLLAAVEVKTEQLNPANPAWKFKTIPGPSKSDVAQNAKVTLVGNQWESAGGDGAVLVNGRLPANSLELDEEALLSNANADGGNLVIDLGRVQPVAAVNSYSWHEWDVDQGSRGPQVYTLYGTAADQADPTDMSKWTKLADVDTRPNTTGAKWNGQHGVSITDSTGKLGDFRTLMFVLQRTRSPLQPNVNITATLFSEIDVHTRDTLAKARDAVVAEQVKVSDIWVVFKTHLDIGYTETIEAVLHKYRVTMMDKALAIIDQDRQLPPEKRFVWTLAGWPLAHALGPLQEPARKARIEQAVKEGSLVFHAIPFTLHTETDDLEDLVRGLGFASRLAHQYGRPLSIAGKMTDVPCHSWVWPTLLSNAGVNLLQVGCNGSSAYAHVPELFWWEGPDGSRILCNYTRQYGSGLTPPRSWPSRNYLAMIMTGDNQGPPSLQDVENIRQHVAKNMPDVRVHFATLDDFARAVLAEKPDLKVVRADMPDTWIHGWLSMPIEAKLAHNLRALAPALESLDTQLRLLGLPAGRLAGPLADVYEQSNLMSEHTFGPFGPNGGAWNSHTERYLYGEKWEEAYARGAYKKYEQAFDDKRAYAHKGDEIVQKELSARLDLLAKSVKVDGERITVYNGLPWARSGLVEVGGKIIYAENVPANGYKTLMADKSDVPDRSDKTVLETPLFTVTFDLQRGGIASLVEKKTGRELVDKASPYVVGQFLHERFDNAQMRAFHDAYGRHDGYSWPKGSLPTNITHAALTPPAWEISMKRTVAADVVTLTAKDTIGLAKGLSLVFTLPCRQPCVDVEWRVTDKKPDPVPEGGWLCFPFAVADPQFLLGRLGGPIDPAKDIIPGGNRHYFCINTGVIVAGRDGVGMGVCPIDSPCVSLGEPGLWKFSFDYVAKKPSIFVNLYNNEWNTNFPEWIGGSWSSRVRLWLVNGGNVAENLAVNAWEARLPLMAASAEGKGGTVLGEQAGVELSRKGVLLTAFGADPDGVNKGTLLRVWEQGGVSGTVTVTLPKGLEVKKAMPVNLRGEKAGEPLKVKKGKFKFELGAYAPASYILE